MMKIWWVGLPNKIKLFMWRVWTNSLPTFSSLASRHLIDYSVCPLCKVEVLTTIHAIRSCKVTKAVWWSLGLQNVEKLWQSSSSKNWIATVQECLAWMTELIFCIAWYLWFRRNLAIHEKLDWDAHLIIDKA